MNSSRPHSRLAELAILVVDDHAINREFLKTGLGRLAQSVDLAANGLEAIELCRQKSFDVIVLDLHMPQMDGLATANRIRDLDEAASDARMIVLTADTRPEERTRLLNAGFDHFLNKPISIPDLAEAIEQTFRPGGPPVLTDQHRIAPTRLIDEERALAASNNDPALASKLRRMLTEELETGLFELDAMLNKGERDKAAGRLHQWSGAAGYAGALRFGQCCRVLRQQLLADMDSSPGSSYLNFLRIAHATRQALAQS
jgi:two-component system, NarL family, sensor histidine kinase BarA